MLMYCLNVQYLKSFTLIWKLIAFVQNAEWIFPLFVTPKFILSCLSQFLLKKEVEYVSDKLRILFFLLINVKMPTVVGILTFISRKKSCSAALRVCKQHQNTYVHIPLSFFK